jgi:hypothetical protein
MPAGPSSEHVTYDLSIDGVRLCGLPCAEVGDDVAVMMQLGRERVWVAGRLVRTGETNGSPDFAIRFQEVAPKTEDAIQDALVEALTEPRKHPSVVLLGRPEDPPQSAWNWLQPVLPMCTNALAPFDALSRLAEGVHTGILSSSLAPQLAQWQKALPKVAWRRIDPAGRLHGGLASFIPDLESREEIG